VNRDLADRSRRRLRGVVLGSGLVASVAGLDTALRGVRSVAGVREAAAPAVESETRFYGAVYLALGLSTISISLRAPRDPAGLRTVAGTIFLAGLARANGWRTIGAPHPLQRALLAIELVGPPALLAWDARVRAAADVAAAPTA
jgi:hypothetical protein